MFKRLGEFATKGYWQASISIAVLSVIAMMFPPISYMASGLLVLATLTAGPKEGIKVVIIATVILALLSGLLMNQPLLALIFAIVMWLPVYGVTLVLGYTRSLAKSLLASVAVGITLVLLTHVLLADPASWWSTLMQPMLELLQQQPNWQMNTEQTTVFIEQLAKVMTALVAAGFTLNIVLSIITGRAWQASLFNQGGFAAEFRQLNLGKTAAIVAIALLVSMFMPLGQLSVVLSELFAVVAVVFAVQGVAVVHSLVKQKQRSKVWLVIMYILLVIMTLQMSVVLGLIGILEQWLNFRRLNYGGE